MAGPTPPDFAPVANKPSALTFTTSAIPEKPTKTPANVKGDYLTVHHPEIALPPSTTTKKDKKRKKSVTFNSPPASTPASASKKARTTEKTTSDAPPTTAAPIATPKTTRSRDPSKKQVAQRIIPRSFEECGPADQALITMRDAGEDWKTIREKYSEITGTVTAHSTLPNRYTRLKSNFTHLREQDNPLLLLAKRQVEASFEAQKWELVAQIVREKGGDVYAGVVLQRQYKKLMVQQGVAPPEGVRDADWEVEVIEE